jgi:hypothetical protein
MFQRLQFFNTSVKANIFFTDDIPFYAFRLISRQQKKNPAGTGILPLKNIKTAV